MILPLTTLGTRPEVFLARGGNFRCWPKADTSSAVHYKDLTEPETALETSLAPRVTVNLPTEIFMMFLLNGKHPIFKVDENLSFGKT